MSVRDFLLGYSLSLLILVMVIAIAEVCVAFVIEDLESKRVSLYYTYMSLRERRRLLEYKLRSMSKSLTYAQDFLGLHPNAYRELTYPKVCRKDVYGGMCPGCSCYTCWNEPMEDTRQAPPIGYCATCSRRGTEYTAETCDGEKLYDCELMYEPVFLSGFCDGYKPKEDENG